MSRLVGLYPRRWRDRYGAELAALLEARPPTGRDRMDLFLGALDARLHPELVEPGVAPAAVTPARRLSGLLASAGGIAWVGMIGFAGLAMERGVAEPDVTGFLWLALVLMALGLIGRDLAAHARPLGRGLAVGGILFALALALPWDAKFVVALPFVVLVGAGMLGLAATRAGLSNGARRWIVVAGFAIPLTLLAPVGGGLYELSPWFGLAILAPYGLAWLLVGTVMALRGSPTLTSGPRSAREHTA